MKRSRLLSFLLSIIITSFIAFLFAGAQVVFPGKKKRISTADDSIPVPNPKLLGTKTPYQSPGTDTVTPPRGFKPVFINYVGRHGARFQTSPKDLVNMINVLNLAERQGDLTESGRRLKEMLFRFRSVENGHYGFITRLGEEEQEGIGRRIFRHYPEVFRGRGLVITTTQKIRTQQSERAFLKGLGNFDADKIKLFSPPDSLNDMLRFFDIAPAYKKYKKSKVIHIRMDSLYKDTRMTKVRSDIGKEFFTGGFAEKLEHHKIRIITFKGRKAVYDVDNFIDDLYGLYAIRFSMEREIEKAGISPKNVNVGSFFKPNDLQRVAFLDGAGEFLEKGPAEDTLGIQIRDAVPLLVDFIRSTDNYIHHPEHIDADLRFAHAETISPFATLLGVRRASRPSPSVFSYENFWQPSRVIPLSANIQWVLYYNGRQYLIKVLLNEKAARLPIATEMFPYYQWNDVKAYYLHKLALLHVKTGENMHQYLLKLRNNS